MVGLAQEAGIKVYSSLLEWADPGKLSRLEGSWHPLEGIELSPAEFRHYTIERQFSCPASV